MLITDYGQVLSPEAQEAVLGALKASAVATFRERGGQDIVVGEPRDQKIGTADARGVLIQYHDKEDLGHKCSVCVLSGPGFCVSCVAQYLDADAANAQPLVRQTLESIRPLREGG
jgi:hypothetical protein